MSTSPIRYGPKKLPWEDQVPDVARGEISAPLADPVEVYKRRNFAFEQEERSISTQDLEIPPMGQSSAEQSSAFAQIKTYTDQQQFRFLGYQCEETISYQEHLAPFLDVSLNNVGDPFVNGNYTINSKFAERMVLDYYASLWNNQWPSEGAYIDEHGTFQKGNPESYWGYVLTMGSTEGNLYGMLNARDYLSGKMLLEDEIQGENEDGDTVIRSQCYAHFPKTPAKNPNAYTPVAFFSEDTHYSIVKAMAVEKIDTFGELGNALYPDENPVDPMMPWPAEVESEGATAELPVGSGAIDVDKLIKYVEFFASKGYPILVVLNYGTTFKGAYDNINDATARLKEVLIKYGLFEREVPVDPDDPDSPFKVRTGYWIHVDGALGANYMPFIKMAKKDPKYKDFFDRNGGYTGPDFDFRNEMVHSTVASGHKWPGAPWPTGVYMTRQKYMVSPPDNPEYIGSPDTTFAGSRNGLSALVLWDYFARTTYEKEIKLAMEGQELAEYAYTKLQAVAKHWEGTDRVPDGLWLQRTPLALSLIFYQPNDEIIFKYSLAKEAIADPDDPFTERNYVHLFTMWDVSKALIDDLCDDLKSPGAFGGHGCVKLTNVRTTKSLPDGYARRVKIPITGRSFR